MEHFQRASAACLHSLSCAFIRILLHWLSILKVCECTIDRKHSHNSAKSQCPIAVPVGSSHLLLHHRSLLGSTLNLQMSTSIPSSLGYLSNLQYLDVQCHHHHCC